MTRSVPLWRQLLRIGWSAGRGARSGRLRFVALLCATTALAVSLTSLVAGFATYDGRDQRGAARSPVIVPAGDKGNATAQWREMFDTAGGLQHDIIYIEPLVDNAPLPPGLSAWPAPGQAVLSPALRSVLAEEGTVDRYGKAVGLIGAEGLSVPGERLAYVRASKGAVAPGVLWNISGYGAGDVYHMGDQIRVQSLTTFSTAVVGLLVLPAGALVVIAARSGAAARDRRTALLRALGAGKRARALINIGEAATPVALGALVAAVPVACALVWNLTVPVVDFTLSTADARRWAPELFGSIGAATLLVLGSVVLLHRAAKQSGTTRPATRTGRVSRAAVWLCPVFLLVGTRGPELADPHGTAPLLFLGLYALGVIGTLATLPAVISWLVKAAGRGLVRYGNRRGRPGPLIAGRWNMAQPGVCARMVAGVVIAIGLVSQIQLWSSRLNDPMVEARATYSRIGDSVLVVSDPLPKNPEPIGRFIEALPQGVHALGMRIPADGRQSLQVQGDCGALKALDVPCTGRTNIPSDARLRELAAWYGAGDGSLSVRKAAVTDRTAPPDQLVLVGDQHGDLPVSEIKRIYYQHMAGPSVSAVGEEWLGGAAQLDKPSVWVMFLGLGGIVFLAVSVALNNLSDFLRFSRSMAPVSVLTGSHTVFTATAAWTIGLPLALSGFLGTVTAVLLGTPLTGPGGGATLSWPVLTYTLTAVEVLAVLFWAWGARSASREAARWRPQAD